VVEDLATDPNRRNLVEAGRRVAEEKHCDRLARAEEVTGGSMRHRRRKAGSEPTNRHRRRDAMSSGEIGRLH
jgi:hypothetical protein